MRPVVRRNLLRGLQLAAALLGCFLLYRVFGQHDPSEIAAAIGRIPALNLLAAALCTIGSYACLAANEYMGIAYASSRRLKFPGRLTAPRVLAVATAAIGIGHSLGFAALSSGAVRYRMYTRDGLGAEVVVRVLIFSGLTVMLSLVTTLAAVLAWGVPALDQLLSIPRANQRWVAGVLFTCVALYIGLCAWGVKIETRGLRFSLPPLQFTLGQLVVGTANYAFIGGVLYACLAPLSKAGYPLAVAFVALSDAAALLIHVPGGWGVLEYIVHGALRGASVVAAVVVFRAVYYLAPLLIGIVILLVDEFAGIGWWRRLSQRAIGREENGRHVAQ